MSRMAYAASCPSEPAQKKRGILRRLKERVRARFARDKKPVGHLGGANPESRILPQVDHVKFNRPVFNDRRDLDVWPKEGTSHEDMEIGIG